LNLPLQMTNADGQQRTIGLELEFAGIKPRKAAELIQSVYGGTLQKEHRYQIDIEDTELGDFRVELDARILRKMASNNIFDRLGINLSEESFRKSIEDAVDKLARSVVPLEIVMPPVSLETLPQLEKLRILLQENKAKGTDTSLVHAFGMHMNIETPDLRIATLQRYLKAFLILYPWLMERLQVDISRRISPFVDPFPDEYAALVLNTDYQPNEQEFVADYVSHNPTRNRPLDMMPILGMLQPDRIAEVMEGEKNEPRPTFHYRLPNSHIDDPAWTFNTEWKRWLAVEKLAGNDEMLDKLGRLYLLRKMETVISFRKEWAETVNILLDLDE